MSVPATGPLEATLKPHEERHLDREVTVPGPGRVFYGSDAGDALGSEVFGRNPLAAADLDSDGRDEVLVVAPLGDGPDNGRKDCGEALILFITAGNGG